METENMNRNIEFESAAATSNIIGYFVTSTAKGELDSISHILSYYGIGHAIYSGSFSGKKEDEELIATFKDPNKNSLELELKTDEWDCLSDYIGYDQYWRGNTDGDAGYELGTLGGVVRGDSVKTIDTKEIPLKYIDFKYGLSLFLQNKLGDKYLDEDRTETLNKNILERLKTEIDYGRPVLVHLKHNGSEAPGDTVIGYGYDGSTIITTGGNISVEQIELISCLVIKAGNPLPPPKVEADTTDPTNKLVYLTATTYGAEVEIQYSEDGGNTWKTYKRPVAVSQNDKTVLFRSTSVSGRSQPSSYTVTNIDRKAPEKPKFGTPKKTIANSKVKEVTVEVTFDDQDCDKKQYSLDNKNWENYTGVISVKSNCTVYARGIDRAGNIAVSTLEIDDFVPDLTVKNLKGSVKNNKVIWEWQKVTDPAYKISYEVKVDGKIVTVQQGNKFTLSNAAAGKHTLSVRAIAGKEKGKWSEVKALTVVVPKDKTAPEISKFSAKVKGYTVTFNVNSRDNVGVTKYVATMGKQKQTFDSSITELTMDKIAIGKHTVSLVAYDAAGNKSKTKKISFTVKDTTAPEKMVSLSTPKISKYKAVFNWSAAKDNSGKIAKYQIQLDNGKIYTTTKTSLTVSNLKAGQHTYRIRAIDKAKNTGAWSAKKTFTVKDVTAPNKVSLSVKVSGNKVTATLKKPKDNVGVTCYMLKYGSKLEHSVMIDASQKKIVVDGLDMGTYKYSIVAYDAAGNASNAKTGKFTIKHAIYPEAASATLCEASFAPEFEASFAPEADVLAYCNELNATANLSDAASALTAEKKSDYYLLA